MPIEYEQQIDDLINTGDINNWRLALELCRGLIDDAELVIAQKCHNSLHEKNERGQYLPIGWDKFIEKDCNCTWGDRFVGRLPVMKHKITGKELETDDSRRTR